MEKTVDLEFERTLDFIRSAPNEFLESTLTESVKNEHYELSGVIDNEITRRKCLIKIETINKRIDILREKIEKL